MQKICKINKSVRIIKNLLASVIAFSLLFTSVNCVAILQPILNQNGRIGVVSQCIVYGVQMVTSLSLPQMVCSLIGFKYAMLLGQALHLSYVAIQFFPNWYTLMPS